MKYDLRRSDPTRSVRIVWDQMRFHIFGSNQMRLDEIIWTWINMDQMISDE